MNLGEKIKKLRKENKLTLKLLGEKVGLSTSFLSEIEKGKTNPSLKKLISIADELNVSICCLMDEECDIHYRYAAAENKSKYKALPDITEKLIGKEFDELREALYDVINWSSEDRKELINYLNAKKITRNSK